MFVSRNGEFQWFSFPLHSPAEKRQLPQHAAPPRSPTTKPRPTPLMASGVADPASAFGLLVTPEIEKIVLDAMNLKGSRRPGDSWKPMDATDLRAYSGLLTGTFQR